MNRNASLISSLLSLVLYGVADYGFVNYSNLHPQIAGIIAKILRLFDFGKGNGEIGATSGGFHLGQDEAISIFLIASLLYGVVAFLFAWSMENEFATSGLRKKLITLSFVAMFAPVHMFLVIKHFVNV